MKPAQDLPAARRLAARDPGHLLLAAALLAACDGAPEPYGTWPGDAAPARDRGLDRGRPGDLPLPGDRAADRPRPPRDVQFRPDGTPGPDAAPGPDSSTHKGTLLPSKLKITYYHLAVESEYSGVANQAILDASCKTIATVSKAFYDALCIEGSGKLSDGRVVNYAQTCSCAAACAYGSKICYVVLSAAKYPWGAGAFSNPLVPLRSWAVDPSFVALKTLLYAPAWDGVKIPKIGGLGGLTHDGCFRADDVGGGIKGWRFDFFAGTKAMYQALEKLPGGGYQSFSAFSVYKDPGRCAHLKP